MEIDQDDFAELSELLGQKIGAITAHMIPALPVSVAMIWSTSGVEAMPPFFCNCILGL